MEEPEVWLQIKDFENYEISSLGRVRNTKTGRILKLAKKGGYMVAGLSSNSKGKSIAVHRLVALTFIENPENKQLVDHIDGNGKNNCINNLRWATHLQNMMNSRGNVNSSSQYKGVSWRKGRNKWRANISVNGKHVHLGYFSNEKDAARAYNNKALEVFQEYAYLNELPDDEDD